MAVDLYGNEVSEPSAPPTRVEATVSASPSVSPRPGHAPVYQSMAGLDITVPSSRGSASTYAALMNASRGQAPMSHLFDNAKPGRDISISVRPLTIQEKQTEEESVRNRGVSNYIQQAQARETQDLEPAKLTEKPHVGAAGIREQMALIRGEKRATQVSAGRILEATALTAAFAATARPFIDNNEVSFSIGQKRGISAGPQSGESKWKLTANAHRVRLAYERTF